LLIVFYLLFLIVRTCWPGWKHPAETFLF